MTSLKIQLPGDYIAALQANATAQGVTIEHLFQELVEQELPIAQLLRAQAAAARIRGIQERSKPDPEGLTVQNYIDSDRP